ncbi:Metallo-dependent phosphatase [Trematosphaeria pertusa]|uniref:Metallo-dependent phosphatase n=1 Tax=Trematosphaeria pertusa TaxID=390896 RepID=A0A6A6I7H7_9PLEO|nr:Metallo-dependent phosphatase [Trematosphaeria pertusa]KAF2246514.1 Metallo-dependent phosphatase [Trematosphaeria pertusa]
MKREQLLWLLTAAAGARPLLEYQQGTKFDYPGLRFDYDRKFHITMFNDLHLADGGVLPYRPDADDKTIGVMNAVLNSEPNTDLVILNGDLISCEWVAPEDANKHIDKIMQPLLDRQLPWGTTFGNHDYSKTCNVRLMSEHQWDVGNANGRQLTWTTSSVTGDYNQVGSSNYYIPIYDSAGGGNPNLKMIIWLFDSKGGRKYQPQGEDESIADWVDERVISWFRLTRDQLNQDHGKTIPSIAFVHIPPHVTEAFQRKGGRTSTQEPGLNEEVISHQGNVCDPSGHNCDYAGKDIPFMEALVETEGLMAVFSGHDHKVDWCMKWSATKPVPNNQPAKGNGMHFCFGRHTGYGGYSDYARGGRHIVIEEDKLGQSVLETWIRLEDGTISGKVTLNATFGYDQYPAVKKTKTTGSIGDISDSGVSVENKPDTTTTTDNQTKAEGQADAQA